MSPEMEKLWRRLHEHTQAINCGSLEDEQMAAGRVIDAINDLPIGDWSKLCDVLKTGKLSLDEINKQHITKG